jgi:predicted MPP superfamily phosphohydrolase
VRARIAVIIVVIQIILFLGHWFLYETWIAFAGGDPPHGNAGLAIALGLLSVTFVAASLLAFRFSNPLVRFFYTVSAAWAGFLTYFVLAAFACWLAAGVARAGGFHFEPRPLAELLFGLALLTGVCGIVNANWIRIRRITAPMRDLPAEWEGRVAALVSDVHLGHVRNFGFARRVASLLEKLRPDAVFIAGDLYDGTAADVHRLAQPFGRLSAPQGAYFVAGNHEEFHSYAECLEAVRRAGVRVLDDEKVLLDGLQIVGVHFRDSVDPCHFQSVLRGANLDSTRASVLLTHAPNHLEVAESEGIALVLCGHTHAGQLFPFRWMPARLYGRFVYGLQRLGRLLVYTSSGVGTWGPPLRVGTAPEIVLIRFAPQKSV